MDRNYTYRLLKCLYEVHSQLGPGLLESIYEEAAAKELTAQGFHVERQVPVPVFYKGERMQNVSPSIANSSRSSSTPTSC